MYRSGIGFLRVYREQISEGQVRFRLRNSVALAIAGLWRERDGESWFTMLTTEPGADVEPFHNRQVVVLPPKLWGQWLYLERPEAEILKTLPKGALNVTLEREGAEEPGAHLLRLAQD